MEERPDVPPEVRILPMDSVYEFPDWSIEKRQQKFFLEELASRIDGEYLFHKAGIKAAAGTVVLFQFRGSLVASAVLRDVQRFDKPRVEISDGHRFEYHGAFYFEPASIKIFRPVGPGIVRRAWPSFTQFSHVKQRLEPAGYPAFARALKQVEGAES